MMKGFFKNVGNAIAIVAVLLVIFGLFAAVLAWGQSYDKAGINLGQGWYYPLTTRVVEVDEEADLVTCEDFNGNLWEFEGCEDWQDGDICSLLMNSKGTEKIYDDEIVLAQYNGTFEGWN